jgi:GNAT superfamily N-acetyltransferase
MMKGLRMFMRCREEERGGGLGKCLLLMLGRIAHATDCARLQWMALDWNRPALGFYEKIGARQLPEWITLRMYREQIARFAQGPE